MTGGVHFVFDRIANLLYEEIEKEQECKNTKVFTSSQSIIGSMLRFINWDLGELVKNLEDVQNKTLHEIED